MNNNSELQNDVGKIVNIDIGNGEVIKIDVDKDKGILANYGELSLIAYGDKIYVIENNKNGITSYINKINNCISLILLSVGDLSLDIKLLEKYKKNQKIEEARQEINTAKNLILQLIYREKLEIGMIIKIAEARINLEISDAENVCWIFTREELLHENGQKVLQRLLKKTKKEK